MSCANHTEIAVPDVAEPAAFEAVIVPHRSLSRKGLNRLCVAIGSMCAVNAGVFIWMGAWPVGGFTGLELLLAGVLLRVNVLGARASEVVRLGSAGLVIDRTDPKGVRSGRTLPATWLRVVLEERAGSIPRLWLVAREVREEIARALGEDEKRDLAAALDQALHRWRNPVFDNPQLRAETA